MSATAGSYCSSAEPPPSLLSYPPRPSSEPADPAAAAGGLDVVAAGASVGNAGGAAPVEDDAEDDLATTQQRGRPVGPFWRLAALAELCPLPSCGCSTVGRGPVGRALAAIAADRADVKASRSLCAWLARCWPMSICWRSWCVSLSAFRPRPRLVSEPRAAFCDTDTDSVPSSKGVPSNR